MIVFLTQREVVTLFTAARYALFLILRDILRTRCLLDVARLIRRQQFCCTPTRPSPGARGLSTCAINTSRRDRTLIRRLPGRRGRLRANARLPRDNLGRSGERPSMFLRYGLCVSDVLKLCYSLGGCLRERFDASGSWHSAASSDDSLLDYVGVTRSRLPCREPSSTRWRT